VKLDGGTAPDPVLPAGAEPCMPSKTLSGGQSGNFGTMGTFCFRTPDELMGWGCSNFDGRTVKVNGVTTTCGKMPLPAKVNGYDYFEASAGTYNYASMYWWGKFVGTGAQPPRDGAIGTTDAGASSDGAR
jgi:hypothetical protein